jgi:hypothetical protein
MSNETVLQMFSLNRTTACRAQRGIRRSQDAGTSDPTVKYGGTLMRDQQICGDWLHSRRKRLAAGISRPPFLSAI